MSKPAQKKEGLFFYLLLLMGFFILLETSFFIQSNRVYLDDFTTIKAAIDIPWIIVPGILLFLFVQLSLHFFYCVLIWVVTKLNARLFSLSAETTFYLGISIWLVGIITVLIANQYYFPNSKFAEVMAMIFFNHAFTFAAFILFSFISAVSLSCALVSFIQYFFQKSLFHAVIFLGLAGSLLGFSFLHSNTQVSGDAATEFRPNIILIGIDSLRPDFLGYFGHHTETPFLNQILSQSTIFTESVTPLARTFPAWISILTGEYPKQTGIRTNLATQNQRQLKETLPMQLQKAGYKTIYATDETRFSNIDKHIGFDEIITPPVGLNDFIVGTFNDFPLSNLLINTSLGRFLFPYSYANRPVYFTYNPDSFLNLLKSGLNKPREKPLFLAVHFCLPHLPFLWQGAKGEGVGGVLRYEASINRVDKQVGDFVAWLKAARFLDHAIVVFLSDHGEALELPGDRVTQKELFISKSHVIPKFYPPTLENEEVNQSAGHGTDVLGLTQYRTLLAFKLYGVGEQRAVSIPGPVSLLDIKPTLLDLLGMTPKATAGTSLRRFIEGKGDLKPVNKHIFLESDFSPEAIRTVFPETRKVLLEGIGLFQVNPETARLTFRDAMYNMILESKQYADIYGDWVLALYPQTKTYRMPILVNLSTGQWTNDLQSPFAQQSPAKEMLSALKTFYGSEIDNVSGNPA